MNKHIYNFLSYIKNNNEVPSPEELNIDKSTLNLIVKKCISENLLDKDIIFVNILGEIQCDESPELSITINGYSFLEENNPVGKVN